MAKWSFLTNHARALVCIAHDPGMRLRDIAAALGITERSAYGIVTDLESYRKLGSLPASPQVSGVMTRVSDKTPG